MLLYSTRIVLLVDQASTTSSEQLSQAKGKTCLSAAQDIVTLVQQYRNQHGLHHAPVIFIYGIVQALRAIRSLNSAPAEAEYLRRSLDECSITWGLAREAIKYAASP